MSDAEIVDLTTGEFELAGDHMKLRKEPDGTQVIAFEATPSGRRCGGCTLCCKLLPVPRPPLNKPAGVRCKHQRHKGCSIYATRPMACKAWACRWVMDDPDTMAMRRPDRVHYVIDMVDDMITAVTHDTGEPHPVGVMQVWVDPAYPDAYKDPALLAYVALIGERHRAPTIIRYSASDGFLLVPPALNNGKWLERRDTKFGERKNVGDPPMPPREAANA